MEIRSQASDAGVADGLKTVSYVVNKLGKQELVAGSIWQPVNIVNRQAWDEIEKKIERSKEKIAAGRVSCLHYYMTANHMDISLLAQYSHQPTWKVLLHMRPFFFKRLGAETLAGYAELFKVSPEDLSRRKLKPPVYSHGKNVSEAGND